MAAAVTAELLMPTNEDDLILILSFHNKTPSPVAPADRIVLVPADSAVIPVNSLVKICVALTLVIIRVRLLPEFENPLGVIDISLMKPSVTKEPEDRV